MSIKALISSMNGPTTLISNYDQNKINLGTLIKQYKGNTPIDNFITPTKIAVARPMEQAVAIPCAYPYVVPFSDTIDLVFLSDYATAAATRRIVLYEFNKETAEFNWKGFITLTFPTVTTHTIRGFRVVRELYSIGTVSVNSNIVTGVGTNWLSDKMSVGCRIGFNSTNPVDITEWYEIESINSNNSITLTTPISSNLTVGSSYVIEDVIIITTTTNLTSTNGGLFITKGIRYELFSSAGTIIPAATTIDNIRAVYWLADAATLTNTSSSGSGTGSKTSWTNQNVYVLNSIGVRIYVYNFRKGLTLTNGKDITTNIIKTDVQIVIGTVSVLNNGRVIKMGEGGGPGNNIESFYFVTTSRVYRCSLESIINGSTSFLSDAMAEIPPGGTPTYILTSTMSSIEYAETLDRLIIITSNNRSYITQYNTVSNQFDHIFLVDDKQLDQSSASIGGVPHPSILAAAFSVWSERGMLYMARLGTSAATNQLYNMPIGAHQTYAINGEQMLISPRFDITDSNKLYNIYVNNINKLGSDTFSLPTEPYKLFYRTGGISDNTGSWNELDDSGDLSGINSSEIQFMIIFKVLGSTCLTSRILSLCLTYEDNTTDSHYEPSVGKSSIVNKIFAYRQSKYWDRVIPNMRIRLYNTNGSLILDDNVISSTNGTFEYSDDEGITWNIWDNSKDNIGNYIRYNALSLPSSVKIRSLLTQN